MTQERPRFWENVRPFFQEFFQFWPDREDFIWAKSIWPIMEKAGFFADCGDEGNAWTRSRVLALAILYAESAQRFGTPDYKWFDWLERGRLTVVFGSLRNLDIALDEVGQTVCFHFPANQTFEADPDFFTPLIRSLVTGSGFYVDGHGLRDYLSRAEDRHFEMCEFREDELRRMWIGGHFGSGEMSCFP